MISMNPRTILFLGVAASVFAYAPEARAAALYTTPGAFAAATTGDVAIDFSAPSSTSFTSVGPTYTDLATGTSFTIGSSGIDVTGKDWYGPGTYSKDFLVGDAVAFGVANSLTIHLGAGENAFGFDIGGLFAATTFSVTLSDGTIFAIDVPASFDTTFFGFTAPGGISSLSFHTSPGETFAITDAVVGTAVPEPASMVLLGSGLVGMFVRRRRQA
jgi:hypothetical protein